MMEMVSQLSVTLFQTLKDTSQIVWKRASRVFLSEGYKDLYWEKEALVHSQLIANAFTYLSLCCTPPHPSVTHRMGTYTLQTYSLVK